MGARYRVAPGATLRIGSASGSVTVTAEDRADVEVEPPDRRVELLDGGKTIEIRSRSSSLEIRCPQGINVAIGGMSGHIRLIGRFGAVKVSTMSGHVEVGDALGDVDVRSMSGQIEVRSCGGRCQLNTKSGRVSVGKVNRAARISTFSGNVELGTAGVEDVEIKSISGRITVRVPEGRYPRARLRSISGRLRCDCPQGTDFEIKANTISAWVEVTAEAPVQ
jgi:DUF4097 and DUF4098 domain-containing protein YvlB